jgi:hypothetical protein
MQPAEHRRRDDLAFALDRSRERRVAVQQLMRARLVVVGDELPQDLPVPPANPMQPLHWLTGTHSNMPRWRS